MQRNIKLLLLALLLSGCGSMPIFTKVKEKPKTAAEAARKTEADAVKIKDKSTEINLSLHKINTEADEAIKYNIPEVKQNLNVIKIEAERALRLNQDLETTAADAIKHAKTTEKKAIDQAIEIDKLKNDKWVRRFTQIAIIALGFGIAIYSYLVPGRGHTAAGLIVGGVGIGLNVYWDLIAKVSLWIAGAFTLYFIFIFIKHRKELKQNGT